MMHIQYQCIYAVARFLVNIAMLTSVATQVQIYN